MFCRFINWLCSKKKPATTFPDPAQHVSVMLYLARPQLDRLVVFTRGSREEQYTQADALVRTLRAAIDAHERHKKTEDALIPISRLPSPTFWLEDFGILLRLDTVYSATILGKTGSANTVDSPALVPCTLD